MFEFVKSSVRYLCNQLKEFEIHTRHLKLFLQVFILFYSLVFLLYDSEGQPVPFHADALYQHFINLQHTRGKEFFDVVDKYKKSLTPKLYDLAPSLTYKGMLYPFVLAVTCWKSFFVASNLLNVTNQRFINGIRYTMFIVFMLMTIDTMDGNSMTKYIALINFTSLHSFFYNQEHSYFVTLIYGMLSATMLPLHLLLDLTLIILIVNDVLQQGEDGRDSLDILMRGLVFNISYNCIALLCIKYYFNESTSIRMFLTAMTLALTWKHYRTFLTWPWNWKHFYCFISLLILCYFQIIRWI